MKKSKTPPPAKPQWSLRLAGGDRYERKLGIMFIEGRRVGKEQQHITLWCHAEQVELGAKT